MNRNIAMQNTLLALAASFVVAACGGGAQTEANPLPPGGTSNNGAPYTGPVARDANVLAFQQEFWANAKTVDRCGSCHNESVGQQPMFVRNDDVNMAYDAALTVTDTDQPQMSRVVEKVSQGHNCWVADSMVCGSIMTTWIENWLGSSGGGGRQITLLPPPSQDPGDSKNFPADSSQFGSLIWAPYLERYCSDCHSSQAPAGTQRQPYHGDPNVDVAYDAAKPKINLDTPANSQLVTKLRVENHNCWSGNCASDAQDLEDAITAFANGISPTQVDPNLVFSKALKLTDGTVASGGNRYEDAQIALWEFKTGSGLTAYDTSGVDPALDLNLSQEVTWYGGWGITLNGGVARGTTTASAKIHDIIQESGEFSIEAWVVPANVTQEEARIVSYSAGDNARNFTLQQTLYNYDFQLRTTATSLNGDPALSTPDADEVLQATLQHVVVTYDPIEGRKIFVNGELVSNTDPVPGGTLIDWQDTFALVLGAETSGEGQFAGTIRLAAVHRRALSQQQVQQNYDVGVGERFYLLFDISETISAAPQSSFILFEVAQYDSHAYLFDKPHFVTLDGSSPTGIPIEGMRIAMNGLEAPVGQTYAEMVGTLDGTQFQELGQPLSRLGAVLPLEKGPDLDEFFLTFDRLASSTYSRAPDPTLVVTETDLPDASRIGLRTFDEINATFSSVLGIDWTRYTNVDMTYQELRQSLPAVEDINTFLSSHQVALAQLAIAYCDAFIGTNSNPGPADSDPSFPAGFFSAPASTSFSAANRGNYITPLVNRILGTGLASQPAFADVNGELATLTASGGRPNNLAQRLLDGGSGTRAIAKGICAATLGNAATLVQ
jgi:hypothetical protein